VAFARPVIGLITSARQKERIEGRIDWPKRRNRLAPINPNYSCKCGCEVA